MVDNPVIIDARRTPIGTTGGMFRDLDTTALAAPVLRALAERVDRVDEVILGNVRGPGGNPARLAGLAAGLGLEVPAVSLDRQCGSGMAALEYAFHKCRSVPGVVLAGGVQAASTEPITTWPAGHPRAGEAFTKSPFAPEGFEDPELGFAADVLAEKCRVSRERQDACAIRSHERAIASQQAGLFDDELVPVAGMTRDERPRAGFTMARLARFRPAFRPGGTVTAANCCGVNDGAAAVTMVDHETWAASGLPGLEVLSCVSAGCDPALPGWGIVPAVQRALDQAGVQLSEIDVVEFNEAFAGQVLACLDGLGIDEQRNCVEGGAIALGHPWAASGAIVATRLFWQLRRRGSGLGLAAIAIGGGQGSAMVVRQVDPA